MKNYIVNLEWTVSVLIALVATLGFFLIANRKKFKSYEFVVYSGITGFMMWLFYYNIPVLGERMELSIFAVMTLFVVLSIEVLVIFIWGAFKMLHYAVARKHLLTTREKVEDFVASERGWEVEAVSLSLRNGEIFWIVKCNGLNHKVELSKEIMEFDFKTSKPKDGTTVEQLECLWFVSNKGREIKPTWKFL